MCFSATASFTAATLLALIGSGALYRARPKYYIVAAIPFIFAFQQTIEGLLWLSFDGSIAPTLQIPLAYVFLAFAYGFWPWWIPWGALSIEQQPSKKVLLRYLLYLGLAVSTSLAVLVIINGVQPEIVQHHIVYNTFVMQPFWYMVWFFAYTAATVIPFFISSQRGMKLFGTLLLVACLASFYFWSYAFGSLWCFWAALLSVSVLCIIK